MTRPKTGVLLARLDTQQAPAQLELKNRALAACAEGVTIADTGLPDNPLIYANEGFERLTGYTVDEVLGRNCRFLQGPGTDLETLDTLRRAIREQRAVTVQLLNYRKDGAPFWNRLSITPVRDAADRVTHFIGVQSDVTAEKEAKDALEQANQRLEAASRALRKDLEAAEQVQRSLLPAELPHVPGMRFGYRFKPSLDVGGDCLNILPLDDRHLGVYILDVAGHGVAAALLSVTLSHLLSLAPDRSFLYQASADRDGAPGVTPPTEVVARLNRYLLSKQGVTQYFTMIYGILDHIAGEFRYVAAGHLGPILVSRGQAPRVGETGGVPVGLLAAATYQEHSMTLAAGDRLYLCTDGVVEAENAQSEDFGVETLLAALDRYHKVPLEQSVESVMADVEAWAAPAGPADDASLLVIERVG